MPEKPVRQAAELLSGSEAELFLAVLIREVTVSSRIGVFAPESGDPLKHARFHNELVHGLIQELESLLRGRRLLSREAKAWLEGRLRFTRDAGFPESFERALDAALARFKNDGVKGA